MKKNKSNISPNNSRRYKPPHLIQEGEQSSLSMTQESLENPSSLCWRRI